MKPTFAETLLDFLSAHGFAPDMWTLFNADKQRSEETTKALNDFINTLGGKQ